MPDVTRVLTAVRNELETAGLIRRGSSAGGLPPLFIEPEGGPPAPGEREGTEAGSDLVVTLRLSGQGGARAGDANRRLDVLDLIYRSTGTEGLKRARALDAAIRGRLVGNASYGTGVLLDELGPARTFALEVTVFAGLGPIGEAAGVRTELAKYGVEVLASA